MYLICCYYIKRLRFVKDTLKSSHKHNGKVQGISFSPSKQYIVSLRGLYDNDIAVRNVVEGIQICDHRVALKYTNFIRLFNNSDESFATGGKSNPRIWYIDYKNTKLISNEIVQGHMRRIWTTAVIDNDDQYAYLGSTTGDIVAIDIQNYYIKHFGPVKDKDQLQEGISQLELLKRTAVLGKITILKIQLLGYGLATKTTKRSMSPKQTRSKKTAVPTRGQSRKVDIKGHVVPIATAERFLIPRQKKTIRQDVYSWELKSLLFYLTVATDQQLECSIIICIIDAKLNRSCHCNGVHGIAIIQSTSEIFAIYEY
ncbi:MAG: putative flagellar associated protein [Streblomastix strix]|uniref:Putative flagellar associated protein n=1 Tax=Streblomastix strix TaxID=222440 RepID=A0A5J4U6D1_9EUKA|nr:MAG: putative flagellar associated protein [Streblomastix strix]